MQVAVVKVDLSLFGDGFVRLSEITYPLTRNAVIAVNQAFLQN